MRSVETTAAPNDDPLDQTGDATEAGSDGPFLTAVRFTAEHKESKCKVVRNGLIKGSFASVNVSRFAVSMAVRVRQFGTMIDDIRLEALSPEDIAVFKLMSTSVGNRTIYGAILKLNRSSRIPNAL